MARSKKFAEPTAQETIKKILEEINERILFMDTSELTAALNVVLSVAYYERGSDNS